MPSLHTGWNAREGDSAYLVSEVGKQVNWLGTCPSSGEGPGVPEADQERDASPVDPGPIEVDFVMKEIFTLASDPPAGPDINSGDATDEEA
jgi:hypothetical protein